MPIDAVAFAQSAAGYDSINDIQTNPKSALTHWKVTSVMTAEIAS